MSCYHPNIILLEKNGITKKDGTKGYKVKFYQHASKEYEKFIKENKDIKNRKLTINGHEARMVFAPCNMCQGCKSDRRRDWATRLELETKNYAHNYFITLTYDDEHLHIPKWWVRTSDGVIMENYNGEKHWTGTLSKEDAEKFMKNLKQRFKRKYGHEGMKYYLCGEYGSADKTERPHIHAILINCPKLDLEPIGRNQKRQVLYRNKDIENVWQKGFCSIGACTWDSITYVAGYVNKKMFGKKALENYEMKAKIPEFALMSNGIGKTWYDQHKYFIYENDEIINSKGKSCKPPKYFDRLMKEENIKLFEEVRKKREIIGERETDKKLTQHSKPLKEQLENEEEYALSKQKAYNRSRIK